jgi:hypothetical protein
MKMRFALTRELSLEKQQAENGDYILQDMTLILAATNGKEIVVGADSHVYEGDGTGGNAYRSYSIPKLRIVNDGRWIIAFSNLGGVAASIWDYLEGKGNSFNPDIKIGAMECAELMRKLINDFNLRADANALLAVFSGTEPRMYRWFIPQPDIRGGSVPPYCGLGCGENIGLYILDMCRPFDDFDTKQLISSVYFGISEVVRMGERRVGKPIDIGIVRPDAAEIMNRDLLPPYEEKSARLAQLLRENV